MAAVPSGTYKSGKKGYFKFDAATYCFNSWDCDIETDLVDVSNFCSQGYQENVAGFQRVKFSAAGPHNIGGTAVVSGKEYMAHFGEDVGIEYAVNVRVGNVKIGNRHDGSPQVEVSGESNGSFTPSIT